MNFKISELKEYVYNRLSVLMQKEGFIFKKSLDSFECKKNNFKYTFKLLFHVRNNEIAIEVFALIYYLPAEKIYKSASGLSLETIGNEIGRLVKNSDDVMLDHQSDDVRVSNREQFSSQTDRIFTMFKQVALPYYRRFNDIQAIDSILNDKPDRISVHANAQYFRCPMGLITAKLVGRSDYKDLERIYDEKMKNVNSIFKDRYENVKIALKNID